ncbi:uncharacterized protein LOC111057980 isoform X3 [Nilaparvata lugens]|uniref:uncharacterized protein LOC111057980 isoform X3 n=1 Tax=Nilaparvata lugens TaxID=108931 RepID=UPI00193D80BB|nr:uncharacterized protein LOC111057980 isoform X3 [Nilaparvata lugens]
MLLSRVLVLCCALATGGQVLDHEEVDDHYDYGVDDPHEDGVNGTDLGQYVGAPCEDSCDSKLLHVVCDKDTLRCECERAYPVHIGPFKGCAKPVRLGEQCFYYQTCSFTDQNAACIQIRHNAICQCKPGFHTVTLQRPNKRVFCTQDLVVLTTDMPTLLSVATGLAVFTALICFVLKLFVGSRPRHYADANLAPTSLLFTSEGGIPLAVHGVRPASRASSERSGGGGRSMGDYAHSQRGSRGVLVPSSRAGAARAAAILLISCQLSPSADNQPPPPTTHQASVHSSASSLRSFSAKRYERENEMRLAAAAAKAREAAARAISPGQRSADPLLMLAETETQPQLDDDLKASADWTSKSSELLLAKDDDDDDDVMGRGGAGGKPSETPITQNLLSKAANTTGSGQISTSLPIPLYENPLALLPTSTSGSTSASGEWDAPPH